MSYEVLARRWRPNSWAAVLGQAHITKTLSNALANDRVAHAFLFTGIRGVGKTTVARLLARALNCADRKGAEPCNECPSCKQILTGSSVDVLEIDGASNRGIDDIRNIIGASSYRPAGSPYRIYIIDEVHQLSKDAFGALLKILEEPPEHVKFIMATTEWQKIPATILSRCQRYDFRRIGADEIAKHLAHIAKKDKLDVTKDALGFLAREADGSMRDAQSLLEQVLAASEGKLDADQVADVLGVPDQEVLGNCIEAIIEGDAAAIVEVTRRLSSVGYGAERFLNDVLEMMRHIMVADLAGVDALPDSLGEHLHGLADRLKGKRDRLDLHRIFGSLLSTVSDLRRGSYPDLVLEMGLLKAASLESVNSAAEIMAELRRLGDSASAGGGGNAVSPRSTRPSPAKSRPRSKGPSRRAAPAQESEGAGPMPVDEGNGASTESGGEFPSEPVPAGGDSEVWEHLLALVQKRHGIDLYVSLSNCEVIELTQEVVTLNPTLKGYRAKLKDPEVAEKITAVAREAIGPNVVVRLADDVDPGDVPRLSMHKIEEEKGERLKTRAVEDPLVQAAVDVLGGRVEKISPLEE